MWALTLFFVSGLQNVTYQMTKMTYKEQYVFFSLPPVLLRT